MTKVFREKSYPCPIYALKFSTQFPEFPPFPCFGDKNTPDPQRAVALWARTYEREHCFSIQCRSLEHEITWNNNTNTNTISLQYLSITQWAGCLETAFPTGSSRHRCQQLGSQTRTSAARPARLRPPRGLPVAAVAPPETKNTKVLVPHGKTTKIAM